jgi:sucrose-phosphate synthase
MTVLITDIDGTLIGDEQGLKDLNGFISSKRKDFYLVYATGRSHEEYLEAMSRGILLAPEAAIINTGSDILVYRENMAVNIKGWHEQISDLTWSAEKVLAAVEGLPGLTRQAHLSAYKVCYYTEPAHALNACVRVRLALEKAGIKAKIIISHGKYIDILPEKCDKGSAAKFLVKEEKLDAKSVIVAGDSENDLDLFNAFERGIAVSNALPALKEGLKGSGVFFSEGRCAAGILEGIKHYLNGGAA